MKINPCGNYSLSIRDRRQFGVPVRLIVISAFKIISFGLGEIEENSLKFEENGKNSALLFNDQVKMPDFHRKS